MPIPPPLPRLIGETERTLQALLQRQLLQAGLTFPEWVALTVLSDTGPFTVPRLVDVVAASKVVASGSERNLVVGLIKKGFVQGEEELTITERGLELFEMLRRRVQTITANITADLPKEDLEAARRVLETVTHRAARLLAQPPAGALQPMA